LYRAPLCIRDLVVASTAEPSPHRTMISDRGLSNTAFNLRHDRETNGRHADERMFGATVGEAGLRLDVERAPGPSVGGVRQPSIEVRPGPPGRRSIRA
jgi:hypothetical protein